MLTGDEETEYEDLMLRILEQSGKRVGLAKKDADPAEKARLRVLIAKKHEVK